MINLHKIIQEKYGPEAIQHLQTWERKVLKASDNINHRIFTLKCISKNIIPVSIRLRPLKSRQFINTSTRKIIEKAERQLLQDRVRSINYTIKTSKDNASIHKTKLASMVTKVDFEKCTNFINKVREDRFNKVKARQVSKFNLLQNRNKNKQSQANRQLQANNRTIEGANANIGNNNSINRQDRDRDLDKWVINLSNKELTPGQKSVLAKGPNYAITPKHLPKIDYITAIETISTKLKEQDTMELRAEVNSILRKGIAPKSNLTKQERIGLAELKKDQDRIILTADKGVALVVMDKEDYNQKARELLTQPAYKELPRDPTSRIKVQLINKLRTIKK